MIKKIHDCFFKWKQNYNGTKRTLFKNKCKRHLIKRVLEKEYNRGMDHFSRRSCSPRDNYYNLQYSKKHGSSEIIRKVLTWSDIATYRRIFESGTWNVDDGVITPSNYVGSVKMLSYLKP